jgi:hypothetical protein
MDTQNFINQVATGDAAGAKETLNDLLSSRAFDMLDAKKIELAQALYSGEENLDVEVQDTADTPVEEE